jgi:ATP phosphoribosyltransferase
MDFTNSYFLSQYDISILLVLVDNQISGSVEIMPNIGLADAIVDIVSSGHFIQKQFKELRSFKSEAVLVVSPKVTPDVQN